MPGGLGLQRGFCQSRFEFCFRISLKEYVFVIKDEIMDILTRTLNILAEGVVRSVNFHNITVIAEAA